MFSHDLAGTRFSPLKQINAGNVGKLKLAWSMPYRADRTSAAVGGLGGLTEVTPVVVNGVMYFPAENRVLALDAATGKQIWRFDVTAGPGGALSKRGVTYWPGEAASDRGQPISQASDPAANIPPRIFVTAGRRLIALNAITWRVRLSVLATKAEVDIVVPYNSRRPFRKIRRRLTCRSSRQPASPATRARTMPAREQRFGNSIPCRKPANPGTIRGRPMHGRSAREPITGASI